MFVFRDQVEGYLNSDSISIYICQTYTRTDSYITTYTNNACTPTHKLCHTHIYCSDCIFRVVLVVGRGGRECGVGGLRAGLGWRWDSLNPFTCTQHIYACTWQNIETIISVLSKFTNRVTHGHVPRDISPYIPRPSVYTFYRKPIGLYPTDRLIIHCRVYSLKWLRRQILKRWSWSRKMIRNQPAGHMCWELYYILIVHLFCQTLHGHA